MSVDQPVQASTTEYCSRWPDDPHHMVAHVVLTFRDSDGKRWLAGALLGPLVVEGDDSQTMDVSQMPDVALMLVDFKVVRRA